MDMLRIKILDPRLAPEHIGYQSAGAAAIDLRSCERGVVEIRCADQARLRTGIAVAVPDGHVGLIVPRSGLGLQGLVLGNLVGVIDPDYRGEVLVCAWNRRNDGESVIVRPLDRIAQLLIVPAPQYALHFVDDLGETGRGAGGFGSTGEQ